MLHDSVKITTAYVSEKISRVRWVPERFIEPNHVITSSVDQKVNSIKVWKFVRIDYADDENEFVPKCTAAQLLSGDVTGLEFVDGNSAVFANSQGYVGVMTVDRNREEDNLQVKHYFTDLHKFEDGDQTDAACTGISVHDGDVATVGEDGRLNILSTVGMKTLRTIANADNCTMSCVSFVSPQEVLTGNRFGIVKCFDIRSQEQRPTETLVVSCEDDRSSNCVTCMTYHPTQKHIILAGTEEGSITVWDLRNAQYAASYVKAHDHSITELAFHQTQPSRLYSASEGGELFEWKHTTLPLATTTNVTLSIANAVEHDTMNPWLSGEKVNTKIAVTSLVSGVRKSINSFDSNLSRVICGGDLEALYLLESQC